MSDTEKEELRSGFKSLEKQGVKLSFMQMVTIAALVFAAFSWWNSRNETKVTNLTGLSYQLSDVSKQLQGIKEADSVRDLNFASFLRQDAIDKRSLKHLADSNRRNIASIQRDCMKINRHITGYVMVKKSGPNGPITLEPATAKNSQINK